MRVELPANVVEMTQVLLDAGTDVNAATIEGATTFTFVVAAEQPAWLGVDEELIHMLMAAGADPNARRGYSMWFAVETENEDLLKLLSEHGGDLDLGLAAALNRVEAMDGFVSSDGKLTPAAGSMYRPGAPSEPMSRQQILTGALSFAAHNNSTEAAQWLLERDADVNLQVAGLYGSRDQGSTPLHQATAQGHIEMMQLLLDHGADPTIEDLRFTSTPRVWAQHFRLEEGVILLKEAEQKWETTGE